MQVTTHIVVERVSKVWEQASYTLTVDLPDDTSPNLIEQEAKAAARHHHDENSYPSSLEWSEEDSETENTALVSVAALDVESAMRRASMARRVMVCIDACNDSTDEEVAARLRDGLDVMDGDGAIQAIYLPPLGATLVPQTRPACPKCGEDLMGLVGSCIGCDVDPEISMSDFLKDPFGLIVREGG